MTEVYRSPSPLLEEELVDIISNLCLLISSNDSPTDRLASFLMTQKENIDNRARNLSTKSHNRLLASIKRGLAEDSDNAVTQNTKLNQIVAEKYSISEDKKRELDEWFAQETENVFPGGVDIPVKPELSEEEKRKQRDLDEWFAQETENTFEGRIDVDVDETSFSLVPCDRATTKSEPWTTMVLQVGNRQEELRAKLDCGADLVVGPYHKVLELIRDGGVDRKRDTLNFPKSDQLFVRNCKVAFKEENGTLAMRDCIILAQHSRDCWLAGRQGLLHNSVVTIVGPNVKRYKNSNRAYFSGVHFTDSKDIVLENTSVDGTADEIWASLLASAERLKRKQERDDSE